jgi:hypothetical protein
MWSSPDLDLREDYETLVRLARRCAYDLRHAADDVPRDNWMNWAARANSWVSLFAKGNPGKDYRMQMQRDLSEARDHAEQLVELCRLHDVPVPPHIEERYLPF